MGNLHFRRHATSSSQELLGQSNQIWYAAYIG